MLDGISFLPLATEQGEREQRPQRPRAPSLDERAKLRPTSYEGEVIVARAAKEQKRHERKGRKGETDPGPSSHSILGRCQVLNTTTKIPGALLHLRIQTG